MSEQNEKQIRYKNNSNNNQYHYDEQEREEESEGNDSGERLSKDQMKSSVSLSSMDSYASSIIQLSDRRNSIFSSVPSIPSPEDNLNLDMTQSITLDESIHEDSMSRPIHTSLPETAALARLTCQQVDEMMTLVLQMIRRMDMLDERVDKLLPNQSHQDNDKEEENKNNTFSWVKGLTLAAIPIIIAYSFNYFHNKSNRRR